jgi:hypothetical protein
MNHRFPLFLGALLVLLAPIPGCVSAPGDDFVKRSEKVQKFTIRTRGEPGQHFAAKLRIDGVAREISGVSPSEFPLEACVLTGTVRKIQGDGTLAFQILVGNGTMGFGSMTEPGDSCRFRYHANGIEVW